MFTLIPARIRTAFDQSPRWMLGRMVLGVVLINGIVSGMLLSALQERERLLEDKAITIAHNYARVLEESVQGSINKIDMALQAAADEAIRQQQQGRIDADAFNAFLVRTKSRLSEPDSLRMAETDGVVRYGTGLNPKEPINISDREYFQQLAASPDAGLLISKPVVGKITKKWVLIFARRVTLPNGRFIGVVYVPVDTQYLSRLFAGIDVGAHGLVLMSNSDLTLIARHPSLGSLSQTGVTLDLPPLRALVNSNVQYGLYRAVSPMDGIERIYAYRRPTINGFNLNVALAREDYLAEMQKNQRDAMLAISVTLFLSILGAVLVYRARQRRAAALQAEQTQSMRMRIFARLSSDWFWEQDKQHRFIWFSSNLQARSGITPQTLLGRTCSEIASQLGETDMSGLEQALERHQRISDWRLPALDEQNTLHYFSLDGEPMFTEAGEFIGYIGSGKDVTDKVFSERHFRFLAHHDPLTGLPNRALFDDRLEQAILVAQRTTTKLALLYIDFDKFKPVNDRHGHAAGDAVLVAAAARMRALVRASDTVARVGGDEFVVLLPEIENTQAAEQIGEKILAALNAPFVAEGQALHISASIGIALFPDHASNPEALCTKADSAMYMAKQQGNALRVYAAEASHRG